MSSHSPEPEASSGDREPCDDGRPVSVRPDEPLSMKDMHQQNTSLVRRLFGYK